MGRKRKGESGHDKVVPLSLPEVQLCVANSIQGDAIDEQAVQRALQGYQLVLQGSLRDASGVVTKEITGHSGYYRNVMRGVAQVFGVEKRSEEAASVMKGAYLSDENEESEVDSFDIEDIEPAPKKRNVSKDVSVFAQEQNLEVPTRKGTSTSARKDLEGVPGLDTTESKEDGNLAKVSNETNLSTHSRESPQTRVPFNRYRGRVPDCATETSQEKSKMISLRDHEMVANVNDDTPKGGTPGKTKQPVIGARSHHAPQDEVLTAPKVQKDIMTALTEPDVNAVGLLDDASPPVSSTKSFPRQVTPDFFASFVTNDLNISDDTRIFSQYQAVNLLEKSFLPGTWLMKHKSFEVYNFETPEKTSIYCMIRKSDPHNVAENDNRDYWQLIVFKNLSSHCQALKNHQEIDSNALATKPSVLVVDSTSLGITAGMLLCCRNFINGVLRKHLCTDCMQPKPKKKELDRIKGFVEALSSNIGLICMPTEPAASYSGRYLLNNMKHLFAQRNSILALEIQKAKKNSEKKVFTLGSGKAKRSALVSIISYDLTMAYAEDVFG